MYLLFSDSTSSQRRRNGQANSNYTSSRDIPQQKKSATVTCVLRTSSHTTPVSQHRISRDEPHGKLAPPRRPPLPNFAEPTLMLAEIVKHSAVGQESFKGETCIYRYHLIFKHSWQPICQRQGRLSIALRKNLYRST